jgi:hypothetical protein
MRVMRLDARRDYRLGVRCGVSAAAMLDTQDGCQVNPATADIVVRVGSANMA